MRSGYRSAMLQESEGEVGREGGGEVGVTAGLLTPALVPGNRWRGKKSR